MIKKPIYLVSLLILIMLGIVLSAGFLWKQGVLKPEKMQEFRSLPNFTLIDLESKVRNSAEWRGQVLVINFWATWCPPCLKEMPMFMELQAQYADRNLQFIGIVINDTIDKVQKFVQENKVNYPILGGENALSIAKRLGNHYGGLPFTLIVDRHNNIITRQLGDFERQEIEEIILPLLSET